MTNLNQQQQFEAATWAYYQDLKAKGWADPEEGDTSNPESLFWKKPNGAYGIAQIQAAWMGWGLKHRSLPAEAPAAPGTIRPLSEAEVNRLYVMLMMEKQDGLKHDQCRRVAAGVQKALGLTAESRPASTPELITDHRIEDTSGGDQCMRCGALNAELREKPCPGDIL